jgi:hypothetical protein
MRRKFVAVVAVSVLALSTLQAQDAKIVAKAKAIYLENKDAKFGDDDRTFAKVC